MVESLAPMWAEEATRCGASGIPDPPPSPPRSPRPLCPAVDAVRQQFAAIAAEQQQEESQQEQQQQQQHEAATPGAPLAQGAAGQAGWPAGTPLPVVLPTPATHGTPLLAMTQAANQAALPQTGGLQPLSPPAFPAAAAAAVTGAEAKAVPASREGSGPRWAGAVGDQTPATPLDFALPQWRLGPGWQAGAPALLDEQLLMSQLTQQRERRLEQQQHWLASQHVQPQAEEAPQALQLDADAWAWLQVSLAVTMLCPSSKRHVCLAWLALQLPQRALSEGLPPCVVL